MMSVALFTLVLLLGTAVKEVVYLLVSGYLNRMEVTKFDYPAWGQSAVAYVIGPVAFYWVIERTTAFIN